MKSIKSWSVVYVASREAKLFAGIQDEIIATFESQIDAIEYSESVNRGGYLDELHIGYRVRPNY